MLILTRRNGETILIDDGIEVTVLAVTGNQVRIGIAAPQDVSVRREEIYQRIEQERETAYHLTARHSVGFLLIREMLG